MSNCAKLRLLLEYLKQQIEIDFIQLEKVKNMLEKRRLAEMKN
jgi:hypothetical protein